MKSGGLLLLVGSLVLWTALLAAPHTETPGRASPAPRCAQTEATPECKEASGKNAKVRKDAELAQNSPVAEELQGAALMKPVSDEKSASGEVTGKPPSEAGHVANDGPAASGGQPGNGEGAGADDDELDEEDLGPSKFQPNEF
ncbi:Hypothetical predicted protein [Podarcis lilfordi]|uniref:Uncharacterized protein n=1 Tax=Podarcis lilfordi TaxID=74358 RepID=A0AA35KI53_9SAUR|nr:Hypothetical predicted protein [Podarcis lilfordi]